MSAPATTVPPVLDMRQRAIDALEGTWQEGSKPHQLRDARLVETLRTEAQITALLYVGDELRSLRELIDRAVGAWEDR